MIPETIFAAKGDLLGASANDTPAVLAVGANGETLVADSSTSTGLRWQGDYAAGKNKIINGNFNIWQRGTSFSFTSGGGYTSDRFQSGAGSGGTVAITRQTFTAGQTDVPNAVYFFQAAYSASGTDTVLLDTRLEDVNTLAGQTATFSFYAKVDTGTKSITPRLVQDFGSGGSSTVVTNLTAQTLTTSWQRFTITSTIPSVSGKTIGTSSYLRLDLLASPSGTLTYQIANLQLEAGSVATAFQTATGTLQGELAACQRYYQTSGTSIYSANVTSGSTYATNYFLPVQMRTSPTVTPSIVANSGFPATNPTVGSVSAAGGYVIAVSNATTTAGFYSFTFTASAEL